MRSLVLTSIFLFLFTFPVQTFADEVDVVIKGMDDAIKSNKQQDHAEVLQKGDDIASKELRYIKSLVEQGEKNTAKSKLFDLIKSSKEDATVAEAMYLSVKWEFVNDPVDTFDRMKTYYPGSQFVGKLKSLLGEFGEREREIMESFEFLSVPGGCFQMGNLSGDGGSGDKPVHEVCLDGFNIGKYEVTQGQWEVIMDTNPSKFKNGENYPVENVSWDDTQEFISKLNSKSGKNYRLPTEAEWEYACLSGGKKEKYCGGDDVDTLAWDGSNSGRKTHPVGTKKANGLGIFDMSGNVWELVQDWYGSYSSSRQNNPKGPSSGSARVNRGGGWLNPPRLTRSTYRIRLSPGLRRNYLGFRLALSPSQQ